MAPLYKLVTDELKIPIDKAVYDELKAKNQKRVEEIEAEIADAEKNLGKHLIPLPLTDPIFTNAKTPTKVIWATV